MLPWLVPPWQKSWHGVGWRTRPGSWQPCPHWSAYCKIHMCYDSGEGRTPPAPRPLILSLSYVTEESCGDHAGSSAYLAGIPTNGQLFGIVIGHMLLCCATHCIMVLGNSHCLACKNKMQASHTNRVIPRGWRALLNSGNPWPPAPVTETTLSHPRSTSSHCPLVELASYL